MTGAVLAAGGWAATVPVWLWAIRLRQALDGQREAAARAAHELRGPVTAIGLALEAELVRARASGDGGRADVVPVGSARFDRWRAVEVELARATLALDDLSSLGVASGAARAMVLERLNAATMVDDAVCAATARAAAAGVRLEGRWTGGPAFVCGDRRRLAQAIGNLITNAIEHGAGDVEVVGQGGPETVRIEVRDCGPGLPAPVAELVRSARGGRGEHGRGLAIAAAAARQHRGRLAAAPAPCGARLVLELPAAGVTAGRE